MFEGHAIVEGISDAGMAANVDTNAFRGMTSRLLRRSQGATKPPGSRAWEDVYVVSRGKLKGLKKLALDMSEGIGYHTEHATGVMTKGALAPIKGASAGEGQEEQWEDLR